MKQLFISAAIFLELIINKIVAIILSISKITLNLLDENSH